MINYPPVPYPPRTPSSCPAKRSAEELDSREERHSTLSNSAARSGAGSSGSTDGVEKRVMKKSMRKSANPFGSGKITPFKAVSRIALTPKLTPNPIRTPRRTLTPPDHISSPPRTLDQPQIALLKSPFKTPTFSRSNSTPSRFSHNRFIGKVGLGRELAEAEEKLDLLKRAKGFVLADLEGGDESEDNLRRLGAKWKRIQGKVAEALEDYTKFDPAQTYHTTLHNPSIILSSPPSPSSNSFSPSEFSEQPFRSTAPSPISQTYLSYGSTYQSFSSGGRMSETTSEFLERIDRFALERGSSREEVLDRMREDEDEEVPTLEELLERDSREAGE